MTHDNLSGLVKGLTTEQKATLLTGKTAWRLYACPGVGLREVVMSDGPAGVRGTGETPGEMSLSLPSPSALSATWDVGLARRVGRLFAIEARRHGVDIVLAPIVNIQRTPVGGRHFENLSEDPELIGDIACAFIEGCQDAGVGVCVKHYVCNDSETARTEYIATIDETTMREVYLAPFERACRDAQAWSVMASYNLVDDGVETAPAVAHHRLLNGILKTEWGYDGAVVSDWTATKTTLEPALGGLDIVMPGPLGPWSHGQLATLVEDGQVPQDVLDDKVIRVLRLARRVGALGADGPEGTDVLTDVPASPQPGELALLRELAARSIVVLKDDDHRIPFATTPGSIALIGPNAAELYGQGGGSARVNAAPTIPTPDALAQVFPGVRVQVAQGATSALRPPLLEADIVAGGTAHLAVTDPAGATVAERDLDSWERIVEDLPEAGAWAHVSATITLDEPGDHWLGLGTAGAFRLVIDGAEVARDDTPANRDVFIDSSANLPPAYGATVTVAAGQPRQVRLEADVEVMHRSTWGRAFASLVLHHELPGPDAATKIADAVAAAQACEQAIVVVGTNRQVESEGWDRPDLDLPGGQNALVEAVLKARPDAIVVVNAGAPVVLPWLDRARTVLWAWFPGQVGGAGLADVVAGRTEPSGRLPWTLPARYADVPVPDARPDSEMRVHYAEGRDVGYRGWLRLGRTPARPFGFGLGWTTWAYSDALLTSTDDGLDVTVTVANTGPRDGRETVQVYLCDTSDPTRPVRWLGGQTGVDVPAGQARSVRIAVPSRTLRVWDATAHAWARPATTYDVLIAHDLDDVRIMQQWTDAEAATPRSHK